MSFESRFVDDDPQADHLCDDCDVYPCDQDCEEKQARDQANLKALLELEEERGPGREDWFLDQSFEREI